MRRFFYVAISVVLIVLSFYAGKQAAAIIPPKDLFNRSTADHGNNNTDTENDLELIEVAKPDLRTVNLITTGNIMATETQINQAKIGDDQYDFSPSFEFIAPYLKTADLVVGDLEVAQAGPDIAYAGIKGYTGWAYFNSPQELSEALFNAGINVFTLANNHAMDRGLEGLMITIDHIRSLGAETFGAYKNQEERDKILIIEINGINIAFIGYTYSTNGNPIPGGHEYSVNLSTDFLDITHLIKDIQAARASGADIVAVFPHWGAEHSHEPQPQRLRQVAEEIAAAGADLIIGGHPKWIQPFEWFFNNTVDGSERASLAVYSQGSFLTHQYEGDGYNAIYSEFSLLLDIELTKDYVTGETLISDVDYEIAWTHRGWQHRVLLLSDIFAADSPVEYNLNETRINRFKEIHKTSVEVIEMYGHPEDMKRAMSIAENLIMNARGVNTD